MHDIWEPELQSKIHQFLGRKSKKFPELHLNQQWDKYEYLGRPSSFTRPRKNTKHR